ncbi:cI repressor protein [Comamonas testosteroni TK102]|uniref:CI repressor protein n=1 Tax=Comamonas testosteroni TK102 TaxID=1392005 RepID=A0A076PLK1_COMTE|nr:S24 family peptidase [Comamonas testosteroni]AIJ45546.1 cI repressor protein [Comamonas testosteroni TK102]
MQLRLTSAMDTLAERVKAARKHSGMTQAALAKAAGANQSDISKIERGEIERTTHLIGLATALKCDPRWLDTGDGNAPWDKVDGGYDSATQEIAQGNGNAKPTIIEYKERRYPLLSSVQAGFWGVVDIAPSEIDDYVVCPVELGDEGFCLQVDGDSMTNPEGPYSFPNGMNVCFKAGAEINNKDFVCIVREGETNAIFKQILLIDGKWFLHSLNPHWPTKFIELRQGDRITGRLKYAGWQF